MPQDKSVGVAFALTFFFGAFGVTLIIGVVAAFVLGDAAAPSGSSETPPTAVAIIDLVFGALLMVYVVRALRRPRDPKRMADMVEKMSKVASSPAIARMRARTIASSVRTFSSRMIITRSPGNIW